MNLGRPLARIGLAATAGGAAIGMVGSAVAGWPTGLSPVVYGSLGIVFAAVGWLIVERRGGNVIGPILLAFGVGLAIYIPCDLYIRLPGPPPGADLLALVLQAFDVPSFVLLALSVLLFPDGRLPSARWGPILPFAGSVIATSIVGLLLSAEPLVLFPVFRSPLGVAGFPGTGLVNAAYVGMVVILLLSCVGLILRWRRGAALERTQIKWLAAAAVAALVVEIVNIATFDPANPNGAIALAASVALALIPIAIGIAILRYRLYEIDRIISRSIGWALVTGSLVAIFAALILAIQGALATFTQGQTVAVAASTLVVFALFQPLRGRVQHAVDRRFDRARFDAERTSAAFALRLRDEVDPTTVTDDLKRTIRTALAPAGLSVWVREDRR